MKKNFTQILHTIICDGCGKDFGNENSEMAFSGYIEAEFAQFYAEESDWEIGDTDLCPNCYTQSLNDVPNGEPESTL